MGEVLFIQTGKEKMIVPGTPVIINRCDRPCAKLVAIVTEIDDSLVTAMYLSSATMVRSCVDHIDVVTPIADFGVKLLVVKGRYHHDDVFTTIPTGSQSIATYADGHLRCWQENGSRVEKLYTTAFMAVESLIQGRGDIVIMYDTNPHLSAASCIVDALKEVSL